MHFDFDKVGLRGCFCSITKYKFDRWRIANVNNKQFFVV